MTVYRAAWVLPIAAPPIAGGWVAVEHGLIAAVGADPPNDARDLGSVAILPALVNAHTHLELSYLRGAIPRSATFLDWIRGLMAARRQYTDPRDPAILDAARGAIRDARATGTGLVGDISNTLVTGRLLDEAGMAARVFYELLAFNVDDPVERVRQARTAADAASLETGDVRISLAAHAPYSVAPSVFAALRRDLDAHREDVSAVHLAESPEEVQFVAHGTGPWRQLLEEIGAWADHWQPPGTSPVAYLAGLGFLDSRVLAVHGVQCAGDDLERLRALGTTVVSCPRSNRYVGVGDPPIEQFYAAGVTVAFGTDSLASVDDLNMFSEIAAARRLAPRVAARELLRSATIGGATGLGFGDRRGTIEKGKQASLIAVRIPPHVGDVEEYLVSGVEPHAITWLDADNPNAPRT